MKEVHLKLLVLFMMLSAASCYRGRARYKQKQCQKITIPLCKEVGYNLTYMPNRFGHKTQFDAGLIIHQFSPLVLINCAPLLSHFVCSLYAPVCDPVFYKEVEPCRSFCEDVRASCEPIMKSNGFTWPDHLKCSNFPTREENNICMKPEDSPSVTQITQKPTPRTPKTNKNRVTKKKPHVPHIPLDPGKIPLKPPVNPPINPPIFPTEVVITPNLGYTIPQKKKNKGCGCTCQPPFIFPNHSQRIGNDLPPCALPCKQYFFKENQMNFITFWLGLWSILALVSTASTVLSFIIDRARFSFTERPILYISFCYLFVSIGYIIRLIYGHESIACNSQTNLIKYSATGPAQCTSVFMLAYFFTNAAWVWWVVLSMNWFLSCGLKWTPNAISSYSQYFHFIAWLIPTVQTMAILAMAAIDGDPVSGICYVGNHDTNTLTIFLIAPLLIYTTLSFSFFLAGIIAICNSKVKGDAFTKMGTFNVLLFIPAITLLCCYFYEHSHQDAWEKSRNCPCYENGIEPHFHVYLLKYSMSLIIGLVTALWILDIETLESWKKFAKKLYHCCHNGGRMGRSNENNNVPEKKYYAQEDIYHAQQQSLLTHSTRLSNTKINSKQIVVL